MSALAHIAPVLLGLAFALVGAGIIALGLTSGSWWPRRRPDPSDWMEQHLIDTTTPTRRRK